MGQLVRLTPEEIDDARVLAERISKFKLPRVQNRKFDANRSDFTIQYQGEIGNKVVSKALNVPVNEEVGLGVDDGVDLRCFGLGIQVKFCNYSKALLSLTNISDFKADVAVLVTPTPSMAVYRIAGWVSRTVFRKNFVQRNWGYGVRYCLEEKWMKPLGQLGQADLSEQGELF